MSIIRKAIAGASAIALAMGLAAAPAAAVQYGEPDSGRHPNVGLIVMFDEDDVPQWRCTATLVSQTVLVTAAHCVEDPTPATAHPGLIRVWFQEDVSTTGYPYADFRAEGAPVPHPGWNGSLTLPNTNDLGVVVLKKRVRDLPLTPLAGEGTLDRLATNRGTQDTSLTVVGYGLQQVKPVTLALRVRMTGQVQLKDLRSSLADGFNIGTTNAPGDGTGGAGTCFGDSGGPVLYVINGVETVVGVNSFVLNSNCKGSSYAYRTDTSNAWGFLTQYVN